VAACEHGPTIDTAAVQVGLLPKPKSSGQNCP
jgi:hypothetical protein